MTCGRMHYGQTQKPILTYFDATGLAEQTRMCFLVGNIAFVDHRVTPDQFKKHHKALSPTGRVPYVQVEGQILAESQAVLYYAARRAGLMPPKDEDVMKGSMAIELMESDMQRMVMEVKEAMPLENRPAAMAEKLVADFPAWCDKYEAYFNSWKDRKPTEHLLGDRLTWLDVYVASSIYRAQSLGKPMGKSELIPDAQKYPVLSKAYGYVMSQPRVAAYVDEQRRKAAKMVFYHFGHPGFCAPIQWAMKIGKLDYEDKVISREEWEQGDLKAHSPSGKLPMLEIDGEKYVETVAILQYVAKRAGLVPEGELEAAHALAVVKLCGEIRDAVGRIRHCEDAEKREQMKEKAAYEMPEMIGRLEEVLEQHQDCEGHVVAKTLTYADLWVAATFGVLRRAARHQTKVTNLQTIAPRMHQTFRMVHAIPAVADHKTAEMTATKPVLTYFDTAGRAEAVRYAMHVAGIDFEDRRVTREDWATIYKAMSPSGQCPFLTVGRGRTIVEARGIMQWVAEAAPQLRPEGRMDRVTAEQLVSASGNVEGPIRYYFSLPEGERDAQKPKVRDEMVAPEIAKAEQLWARAKSHEGYSVGDHMTYVDCWIAGYMEALKLYGMLTDNWSELYPTIYAVYNHVIGHPKVAAYREAHYP